MSCVVSAVQRRHASPRGVAPLHLPVEVAVVSMCVMEMSSHEVVGMVAVWNGFVAAIRPVVMVRRMALTLVGRRAERWVDVTLRNAMVVDPPSVHVMQMALIQEVTMPFVGDHRMPTPFVMKVHVLRMNIVSQWALLAGQWGQTPLTIEWHRLNGV